MNPFNPTVGPLATDLLVIVNVLIGGAGLGVIFFAASYAIFFNWRKTQSGRSLMYFVLALVSVLVLAGLSVLTHMEYFGRAWIRVVVYAAIAATVWNLSYQLWTNYKRGSSRLLDVERRKASRDESVDVYEKTVDRPRKKK